MKIAVLGTGGVGRTLAGGLSEVGHDVLVGTRDVAATLARTEGDAMGNPPFAQWQSDHPRVQLVEFGEAASKAEVVFNATAGTGSLPALAAAGSGLDDKVLVDVANPLDFSQGMPPTLFVANNDSLAEQIQQNYPRTKGVKTLNTMNARLMVNSSSLPGPRCFPCRRRWCRQRDSAGAPSGTWMEPRKYRRPRRDPCSARPRDVPPPVADTYGHAWEPRFQHQDRKGHNGRRSRGMT